MQKHFDAEFNKLFLAARVLGLTGYYNAGAKFGKLPHTGTTDRLKELELQGQELRIAYRLYSNPEIVWG